MWLLTKNRKNPIPDKSCHISKKLFENKFDNDVNYRKFRNHCHYTEKYRAAVQNFCNLIWKTPEKITVVLHNVSNYKNHLFIRELTEEF